MIMTKKLIYSFSIFAFVFALAGGAIAKEITVKRGESLSIIAVRELGDINRWQELADLNGISDPRRLKEGQSLIIPDAEGTSSVFSTSSSSASIMHLQGVPSLRKIAGAIRFKSSDLAGWSDLKTNAEIKTGSQIMTANTGIAELKIQSALLELGNFSILKIITLDGLKMQLVIGNLTIKTGSDRIVVLSGDNAIEGENCEFKLAIDEAGALRATVYNGSIRIIRHDGTSTSIEQGFTATVKRGAVPELKEVISPVKLAQPKDNALTDLENILFQWNPVQGAKSYRFELIPESENMPKLIDEVTQPKIQVNAIPEGKFSWSVTPIGIQDAIKSKSFALTVDRSAPLLKLNPPRQEGANWIISGNSTPNAIVMLGNEKITASNTGSFEFRRNLFSGVLIAGVEARARVNGAASRAGIALAGRVDGTSAEVVSEIPSGKVLVNGLPLQNKLQLAEGTNNISWSWEVESEKIAGGSLKIVIDMTPPEILSVRAEPDRIKSGDRVTIKVGAKDRGMGLGEPDAARITIVGPGSFELELNAKSLSNGGEYIFEFDTPRNLKSGYLRITKLEVSDRDGNTIIMESEGMATETVDPRERLHKFFSHIIFLGVGILVGSL